VSSLGCTLVAGTPQRRFGNVGEVADVVLFLI